MGQRLGPTVGGQAPVQQIRGSRCCCGYLSKYSCWQCRQLRGRLARLLPAQTPRGDDLGLCATTPGSVLDGECALPVVVVMGLTR